MFKRLFSGSRMTRECHVRFCEKLSGFVGRFTHQKIFLICLTLCFQASAVIIRLPGTDRSLDLELTEPIEGVSFREVINEDLHRSGNAFEIAEVESFDSHGNSLYQHFYGPTFRRWCDEHHTNPLNRDPINPIYIRYYKISLGQSPDRLLEMTRRALAENKKEEAFELLNQILKAANIDPVIVQMSQTLLELFPKKRLPRALHPQRFENRLVSSITAQREDSRPSLRSILQAARIRTRQSQQVNEDEQMARSLQEEYDGSSEIREQSLSISEESPSEMVESAQPNEQEQSPQRVSGYPFDDPVLGQYY